MSEQEKPHNAKYIGKKYETRLNTEEAAYVERVRVARKLRYSSFTIRLIIQDAMQHHRLEG